MFTRTTTSLLAALALPVSLLAQGFPLEPGGGGGGSGTVTSIGVTGSTGLVVGGSPITTSGTITLTLDTELGQIAALADPNADRGLFWDDSVGALAYFEFGSGLTMTGNVLSAVSLGDGDKGDITVSASGATWTIDDGAVTLAKMANLSTATFIGRTTAGTGVPEELSVGNAKTMLNLTGTNSGDVTLAGSLDYLTLASQVITLGPIDLSTDTTGLLAGTNVSFSDPESNFSSTTLEAALVELNSVDGSGPNTATAKVDWSQIGNMPPAFADGTDDGGVGGGADPDAIHDNVSGEISLISEKTLPVGADLLLIEDSAASDVKRKIQIASQETALEAVMDLNQMQGAVSDSQVPDTITVNTANAGDSATAFFTTGQIERARGGTGTDTSAYGDGLIGSLSGGATADIDSLAELETAIGGANIINSTEIDTASELNALVSDADFVPQSFTITVAGTTNEITSSAGAQDLSTNRTWTLSLPATIDLGGKTSFELPNGSTPTVDAFGEIAGDDNVWGTGRGALVFYDGTAAVALLGTLVSDTPTDGQVPRFNDSTDTITWETFSANAGGSDGQVQYNNGGALGGATGITYNDGTGVLTVGELTTSTLNATAFRILDNVDQSHALNIIANENLASDINLNVDLDGVSRNLRITGNSTLSGDNTGDQTITLTGEVTSGSGTGSLATTITNDAVTYAKMQNVTDARLIGRSAGSSGDPQEITVGAGLTLSGGALTATAGGTAWTDIGDATADTAIALGAFETDFTSTIDSAGKAVWTLTNTDADAAADNSFIDLRHNDGADANVFYMRLIGDNDGTPVNDFLLSQTAFTIGSGITTTYSGPTALGASATATTPAANDNDTSLATTEYVQTELTGLATDTVTFQNKDLTNANNTLPCEFIIACSDLTTALTTGTIKAYFRAPYAFTVTSVQASLLTAPTGANLIVDINDGATSIMSTNKLSIDATEITSATAATPAGITDTSIASNAEITIDIDQVGSTFGGAALLVTIQGTR